MAALEDVSVWKLEIMADKLARRCDGFREFGLVFGAAARVRRGDTSGSWERSGDHLASAIPRLTTASRPKTQDLRPSSRATTARRNLTARFAASYF